MNTTTDGYTVWVCVDCYYAHHGLETEDDYMPDQEPLSLLGSSEVSSGLAAEEHADDCPVWLGDPNRPDVPIREAECDCERQTFSWSPCEGCGSTLGGEREALTVWLPQ